MCCAPAHGDYTVWMMQIWSQLVEDLGEHFSLLLVLSLDLPVNMVTDRKLFDSKFRLRAAWNPKRFCEWFRWGASALVRPRFSVTCRDLQRFFSVKDNREQVTERFGHIWTNLHLTWSTHGHPQLRSVFTLVGGIRTRSGSSRHYSQFDRERRKASNTTSDSEWGGGGVPVTLQLNILLLCPPLG